MPIYSSINLSIDKINIESIKINIAKQSIVLKADYLLRYKKQINKIIAYLESL